MPKKIRCFCLLAVFLVTACQTSTPSLTPAPTSPTSTTIHTALPANPSATVPVILPEPTSEIDALRNMPIDVFYEVSFRMLMLRDPEWVTTEGLSERFGVRDDRLTDVSDAYLHETFALVRQVLEVLHSYDRSQLSPEELISYDTYEWYLEDLVEQEAYIYNDYPVNQLAAMGVQYLLQNLFTDQHPMNTREDAEDYLSRLGQMKTRFEQIVAGLRHRQEQGILPPRMIIDMTLRDLLNMVYSQPEKTPYYTAFHDKLENILELNDNEREEMLVQARAQIETSVLPGYQTLTDYLQSTSAEAPNALGVWQVSNGPAYYQYALCHHTTTELTPTEIHNLGLQELDRIHLEMREIFDTLGYPDNTSLSELYDQVATDGGVDSGNKIMEDYQLLIDEAEQRLDVAFDFHPKADIQVVGVPSGGFYLQPSLDGSRPGTFYATYSGIEPRFGMPTLAYHEGIPGHHWQVAIAREQELPLFRNILIFNAYAEGWALYAERLASELGWYKDNPYGDLGRLQWEAVRASRLVVDTGIHDLQWTFNQGVDFLVENTGVPQGMAQYETLRYAVWPAQADAYYVGMVMILELRQQAQEALGDNFDLVAFHHIILENGSMPLPVLEQVVQEYISADK